MASPTGIFLKKEECPIPATGLTDASRQGLIFIIKESTKQFADSRGYFD